MTGVEHGVGRSTERGPNPDELGKDRTLRGEHAQTESQRTNNAKNAQEI